MTEFLTSLDQWCFQVLMILYHLMGVQDIPSEASPHWKVVERWSEQPGGYYRLILESETAAEECRSGRAKYIVFPQTYMAKQEVYSDSVRVYTNEMDRKWDLRSIIDRAQIRCDIVAGSKKIKFLSTANMKYFASINSFPFLSESYPKNQFLFDLNYVISAVVSLTVAIVATIILWALREVSLNFLGMGASIFLFMMAHAPGYIFQISLIQAHQVMMVGILFLSFFYMRSRIVELQSRTCLGLIFLLILAALIISTGFRNTNQLIMLACGSLTAVFGMFYAIFSKKLNSLERSSLFIVLAIASIDIFRSQAYRNGYLNLSFLIIAVIIFELIVLVLRVHSGKVKSESIQSRLNSERNLFQKVNSINNLLKGAIHDLKAPVTSLNFISKTKDIDRNQLEQVTERFNSILQNIESNKSVSSADWYTQNSLKNSLNAIVDEMKSLFKEIEVVFPGIDGHIFFDLSDLKNIAAEILMNSYKASNFQAGKSDMKIRIYDFENEVKIVFSDNVGGASERVLSDLGEKGITTNGSGLGLWMIRKKINEVGGSVLFKNSSIGFEVSLILLKKR